MARLLLITILITLNTSSFAKAEKLDKFNVCELIKFMEVLESEDYAGFPEFDEYCDLRIEQEKLNKHKDYMHEKED